MRVAPPHGERGLKLAAWYHGHPGIPSLPPRGVWIEIAWMWQRTSPARSRSRHGECGLKYGVSIGLVDFNLSLPPRGAWIEPERRQTQPPFCQCKLTLRLSAFASTLTNWNLAHWREAQLLPPGVVLHAVNGNPKATPHKCVCGSQRIYAPVPQVQKWEIHTVFPHFWNFEPAQNLSLSFLADVCGAVLMIAGGNHTLIDSCRAQRN